MIINPSSKHVGDEIGVPLVNEQRELQRVLPKAIDQILQHIDSLLAIELVICEGIWLIAPLPGQIRLDVRCCQLTLPHRHGYPEGEDRIHETVSISNA